MNKPTLLAIGDSFTYGEELEFPDRDSWPTVLANMLNYQVINKGIPASSNCKIIRQLLETNLNLYDLVVIAWSNFDRIELADENGIYDAWPGGKRTELVNQAPWRKTVTDYITRHHDSDYTYRKYLINVILVQSYLKTNNKPYVMLDAFGNHVYTGRTDPNNIDLIEQIDVTRYLGWPNESMLEWTKNSPTGDRWPILFGPHGHFLEEGHQIVANKIYKHIDFLNLI